jgi:hypothetical protein
MDFFPKVPSPLSAVLLMQMGGAVRRVAREATAFYHRDAAFMLTALSGWTDPGDDAQNVAWARDLWSALQPFAPDGVYVNELVDEGEDRIRAAYGPAYDRLAALKNRYDPANLFRLNQNIRPTG